MLGWGSLAWQSSELTINSRTKGEPLSQMYRLRTV